MRIERIKSEIRLLEKTQNEFALSIGLNATAFYRILLRKTTSLKNLIKICKGLDVSTDYILGLKDEKQ